MAQESEITSEILDDPVTATAPAPKILVAEDISDLRDAIVMVLREQGYHVRAASDGLEATALVLVFEPDLVILDMRMPRMSGTEACAAIRKTSNVPIIMFTSSNDAADVSKAIANGATDFVLKTTGVAVLTERVRFHLENPNHRPRKTAIQKTAVANTGSQAPPKAQGPIKTTILVIDADQATRDLVKSTLKRLNQNIIEASTAAEAIKAFRKYRPHILVTEWSLPDMDAFNMLTEMMPGGKGRRKAYKYIMSARLAPESRRKARFVGVTDFLHKPLDAAKVEKMIADCVRRALVSLKRSAKRAA
jgi:DNA-binding response OmpR family regulator